LMARTPPVASAKTTTADDLIQQLDAAGIKRAVVLSTAYIFEQPSRQANAAEEKVRRDNDWTSQQVARFPDRLIGFCGLNPLKDYALDELARCASDRHLNRGLKLHFGNSVVDYHNPAHIEQVRRVFRAANDHRMAIVVHMRASVTQKLPYGRAEALIFLNELLPAAPDVVVQVAHLAGAGSWQDEGAQQAFEVLADAVARRDPRAGAGVRRRRHHRVEPSHLARFDVLWPKLQGERRQLMRGRRSRDGTMRRDAATRAGDERHG